MNTIVKKFALVALCTTALTVAIQTAHAAPQFTITGVPQNGFSYGTTFSDDNVINFTGQPAANNTGSTVNDPNSAPSTWLGSGLNGNNVFVNSMVTVTGLAPGQNYSVNWTYVGSESDNVETFTAPGGISHNEDNRNNNCGICDSGPGRNVSTVPMGSTAYNNGDIPAFTVADTNAIIGGSVTNGGPNPTPANFLASLIFSYATFNGTTYTLTSDPTNAQFVVFGFNDNGFGDDNHDDFVGVMALVPGGLQNETPIPGALPLFGSVLGGGLLFRRLRKRNKTA
jgi:hypothetical protein